MRRSYNSPIRETLDSWPLAASYTLRYGRDAEGELWVAVEDPKGRCEEAVPYRTYIEMERSRTLGRL